MAGKDQTIGALIFLVCIIVAIGYIVVLVAPQFAAQILLGDSSKWMSLQFWAVAIVVLIAFLVIMFIGAWIGLTMATTPPPKPAEEAKTEEAKTEPKTEEAEKK